MRRFAVIFLVVFTLLLAVYAQEQTVFDSPDAGSLLEEEVLGLDSRDDVVRLGALLKSIRKSQALKDTEYAPRFTYPPIKSWQRQRGIYDSFVHLNFHGAFPQMALLRNGYRFPDDNAFVTLFIAHALVEVAQFDAEALKKLSITDEELTLAVQAISTHRDYNSPSDLPLLAFWNQQPADESGTHFRSSPQNIKIPLSEANSGLSFFKAGLAKFGLDKTRLGKLINTIVSFTGGFTTVFAIPPDSDDTGCNLALGPALTRPLARRLFPGAAKSWLDSSMAGGEWVKSRIVDHFIKYSYRPLSADYSTSSIDPRTYYWIRGFLQKKQSDGVDDLRLITTWHQSIDEVLEQRSFQKMPFAVNNVDASVTANALFGIVSYYFAMPSVAIPFDHLKFINENIELLAYVLENRLVEMYNPIVLLYYPPKFAFYWFVARLYNLMSEPEYESRFKHSRGILAHAMPFAVKEIVASAQCVDNFCHWDDFLGNGDHVKNETHHRFEDRVFSTSMALNALIDTSTIRQTTDSGYKLKYRNDTSDEIKHLIGNARNWLKIEAWRFPKQNAFFSGSIKAGSSVPFYYPHNEFRALNGTSIGQCSSYKKSTDTGVGITSIVASVAGIIPEEEYKEMIETFECFGNKFPEWTATAKLNCPSCIFPFWSSPALTNALHLLSESKFLAITN